MGLFGIPFGIGGILFPPGGNGGGFGRFFPLEIGGGGGGGPKILAD